MTYQIHRYPAELIDVVRLANGERVVIRPVLPQDEDLTTEFFRNLSDPARHNRFMAGMGELPPELIRRFVQVDYSVHVALVAEVFSGGSETVIAEARYVRLPNAEAEFAVSVAEPWQGKKLASLLLGKLACRAAAAGVKRMMGETLATNVKMISLARKAGFTITPSLHVREVVILEKALPSPLLAQPCNDAQISSLAA
jgi:GNAT superfamily N-acetyltransferase